MGKQGWLNEEWLTGNEEDLPEVISLAQVIEELTEAGQQATEDAIFHAVTKAWVEHGQRTLKGLYVVVTDEGEVELHGHCGFFSEEAKMATCPPTKLFTATVEKGYEQPLVEMFSLASYAIEQQASEAMDENYEALSWHPEEDEEDAELREAAVREFARTHWEAMSGGEAPADPTTGEPTINVDLPVLVGHTNKGEPVFGKFIIVSPGPKGEQ